MWDRVRLPDNHDEQVILSVLVLLIGDKAGNIPHAAIFWIYYKAACGSASCSMRLLIFVFSRGAMGLVPFLIDSNFYCALTSQVCVWFPAFWFSLVFLFFCWAPLC